MVSTPITTKDLFFHLPSIAEPTLPYLLELTVSPELPPGLLTRLLKYRSKKFPKIQSRAGPATRLAWPGHSCKLVQNPPVSISTLNQMFQLAQGCLLLRPSSVLLRWQSMTSGAPTWIEALLPRWAREPRMKSLEHQRESWIKPHLFLE